MGRKKGKQNKSIEILKKIILNPKYKDIKPDAYLRLHEIYYKKDNLNKSLEYLKKISVDNTIYPDAELKKVDIFIEYSQYDKAMEILNNLNSKNINTTILQLINYKSGKIKFTDK